MPDALYLRAVEERNHHSIVLHKGMSPAHRAGLQGGERGRPRPRRPLVRREGLPTAFRDTAHQGRTLRTADPHRHAARVLFQDGSGRTHAAGYSAYQGARIQRIDHLNCFTSDVQASYDFYTELGFRLTEYTETDGNDRSSGRCGCIAKAMSTISPSPTAAARACTTSASGPRRARHPPHLRRDGDVGLSRQHGARPGPARHLQRVLPLYPRSGRAPHRAVHLRLSHRRPRSRAAALVARDPQRQTLWGHPAPESWFEEGTGFADVAMREPGVGGTARKWQGKYRKTIFIDCNEQLGAGAGRRSIAPTTRR